MSNGYESREVRREHSQRRNVLLVKIGLGLLAVAAVVAVIAVMT